MTEESKKKAEFIERSGVDRRQNKYGLDRRKHLRREGLFTFRRTVYLSNTNSFQNCYFAEYSKFMGEAREAMVHFMMGEHFQAFAAQGWDISTHSQGVRYFDSFFLFDTMIINVKIVKMIGARVVLEFDFVKPDDDSKSYAKGDMTICFKREGIVRRIPPEFIMAARSKNLFKGN